MEFANLTNSVLEAYYQHLRDEANRVALELERRGYKGKYVTPSGRRGDLSPDTRPTQFEWTKS